MSDKPKVGIVVVTYSEKSQNYLDLCLRALARINYPISQMELVVISSGEYESKVNPSIFLKPITRHIHLKERHHYPEAVNFGVSQLSKDCLFYWLLNDDTIPTKDSLLNMVGAALGENVIVGPISNCDNGWRYHLLFLIEHDGKPYEMNKRFYRYDEVEPYFEGLLNASSKYILGNLYQDFICFYSTIIPKKVWDEVGTLDPMFKTGQDDVDYSFRCLQKKIRPIIAMDALVWHFGGVTADHAIGKEIRDSNKVYFKQKWGVDAP
jgi:GT2 family glycosyltransferase